MMLTPTHTQQCCYFYFYFLLFYYICSYLQVSLMLHTLLLQVIPVLTPTLAVVVSLTMILLVTSALAGAISCAIP